MAAAGDQGVLEFFSMEHIMHHLNQRDLRVSIRELASLGSATEAFVLVDDMVTKASWEFTNSTEFQLVVDHAFEVTRRLAKANDINKKVTASSSPGQYSAATPVCDLVAAHLEEEKARLKAKGRYRTVRGMIKAYNELGAKSRADADLRAALEAPKPAPWPGVLHDAAQWHAPASLNGDDLVDVARVLADARASMTDKARRVLADVYRDFPDDARRAKADVSVTVKAASCRARGVRVPSLRKAWAIHELAEQIKEKAVTSVKLRDNVVVLVQYFENKLNEPVNVLSLCEKLKAKDGVPMHSYNVYQDMGLDLQDSSEESNTTESSPESRTAAIQ